jgi:mannose-6-phosphate isomerase-like protein (cupin superfamily)
MAAALSDILALFTEQLGFRLCSIYPADHPTTALIEGTRVPVRLRLTTSGAGVAVEPARAEPPALELPPLVPSLVVTRQRDGDWGSGRAGMQYRDLIPDRQGGRVIASHIRIPDGGPVPDYVHYHDIRFQMIYCRAGWVRVVYEDQGEPFVLSAGDCVLQPPRIRHRVLDCAPGLEVIELGSPAVHATHVDHELALPTGAHRPHRDFGGQRFTRHIAADATWKPWRAPAFHCRDLGIAAATGGAAGARVAKPATGRDTGSLGHAGELSFGFVLAGAVSLDCTGRAPEPLAAGDAFAVPAGLDYRLTGATDDLELLDVTMPA